jgi:hypothetical protein
MHFPQLPSWRALLIAAASAALPMGPSGCGDDSKTPEARTAEDALKIDPKGSDNSTEKTRNVIVTKETTVKDAKTGRVLSDKVESAPVTITQKTEVKKNVRVDVGETKETNK